MIASILLIITGIFIVNGGSTFLFECHESQVRREKRKRKYPLQKESKEMKLIADEMKADLILKCLRQAVWSSADDSYEISVEEVWVTDK